MPDSNMFVTIRDNRVLLWKEGWNSPVCTVTNNAQSAVLYGDEIIIQFLDGTSAVYRLTESGTSAYPVRRMH
jgi:hypothetical protein